MKIKHKLKNMNLLLYIFIIFFCLFSFLSFIPTYTNADNNEYSKVLDDLKKDEGFNIEDYPLVEDNHSLQVIQIAESNDKELFIYVYQPSAKYIATSIDFSTTYDEDDNFYDFNNYKLKLLNQEGTLSKYVVENFSIKDDDIRYYNITDIYRNFDETVDEDPSGDGNVTTEVAYEVGQLWSAETKDNDIKYDYVYVETIEIVEKYVGFLRYEDGFFLSKNSCDSHYIAFSTDKYISKLFAAEIYYTQRTATRVLGQTVYGEYVDKHIEIEYKDVANSTSNLLFKNYSWDRIQKTSDFISDENDKLDDSAKESIEKCSWILRFAETPYFFGTASGESWTRVENVSILRLKFESFGITFDLGVVDNKTTGKSTPDNVNWWETFFKAVGIVLGCLGFLILFIFLWPFISPVLSVIIKFLLNCLKYIFKGIWWVITAPFSVFNNDD